MTNDPTPPTTAPQWRVVEDAGSTPHQFYVTDAAEPFREDGIVKFGLHGIWVLTYEDGLICSDYLNSAASSLRIAVEGLRHIRDAFSENAGGGGSVEGFVWQMANDALSDLGEA